MNRSLFDGWPDILDDIQCEMGCSARMIKTTPISGGSINSAYRLDCMLNEHEKRFFVKINRFDHADMFAAEVEGLKALGEAKAIRVPQAVLSGMNDSHAWIVTEYIAFGGADANSDRKLGEQLAMLHRHTSDGFGWHRDNTIGSTAQLNPQMNDWPMFWRQYRLGYQFDLLAGRGVHIAGRDALLDVVPTFFASYQPVPSLLHGDLWGGNRGVDDQGEPIIFDPAVYYGDRETDLAMTELFGGFGADFYASYQDTWPLDADYAVRKRLYNLYHILNHANLFGGAYLHQAEGMVARLLAEVR